jgi:hypothetical protein
MDIARPFKIITYRAIKTTGTLIVKISLYVWIWREAESWMQYEEWRNITEITDSNMTYIGTVKSGGKMPEKFATAEQSWKNILKMTD